MLPHYLVKYLCPRKCQAWEMSEVNSYARRKLLCKIQHHKAVEDWSVSGSPTYWAVAGAGAVIIHATQQFSSPSLLSLSFKPTSDRDFFACVRVMTITGERLKINVIGEGKGLGLARMVTWSVCPRSSDSIKGSLMLYHTAQDAAYAAHVVWAVCLSVGYRA